MSNKVANYELLEDLKVEMEDSDRSTLRNALVSNANGVEITRINAHRILAHAMFDTYRVIPMDHEPTKSTFRQFCKKYLSGAHAGDEEKLVAYELVKMVMEG